MVYAQRPEFQAAILYIVQHKTAIVAHNQDSTSSIVRLLRNKRGSSRLMKSNYSNTAQLKDLMTVPPMTAAQHAEVMRKRIQHRRMVEEAKEMKKADSWQFDKR
jgi:ketol-acid reductoisomerase